MPQAEVFADIHCHTLLKYIQNDVVDLWEPIGRPRILENLVGAVRSTAADLKNLAQGDVQIACVALTPPEQKILAFQGPISKKVLAEFSSFLSTLPSDKIKHYQSEKYDHFDQLNKEVRLYLGGQNISKRIKLDSTGKKTRCRYIVARNYADIQQVLDSNNGNKSDRVIALVLTIESSHALGTGHLDFNGTPNGFNVSEDLILKRVDALKGISSPEAAAWSHPPVWMTMTHAFYNNICGHAQPLTGLFRKILDFAEPFPPEKTLPRYEPGINAGLSDLGKKVIQRLLGIDEVSLARADRGKRIHIDIKHMSTRSRQDYYDLLDAYQATNPADVIPVIMSHAAVNGKPSLNDQGFNPADLDKEWEESNSFNPWSINLYDDEIIRIHQTKGLIGLIFYEPILSGKKKRKGKLLWNEEDWAELFADQIEHIVKTVYNTGAPNKHEIWDRICIGSDFDGTINPTDKFAASDQLPTFKKFLKRFLNQDRFNPYRTSAEVNELAEKICYKNVVEFLKTNF
ncbi:MAG: membrane dipeptidase [Adhaeribacter sp.]